MRVELFQPQVINEIGKRQNQEDSVFPVAGTATAASRVFVVCDGMGGHEQGEVASGAVSEALGLAVEQQLAREPLLSDAAFKAALLQAYDALDAADKSKTGRMGTTMTFLCFHRGGCMVAHIGDSRIYHLRPRTGEVLFRSSDHSLVQQLYDMGEISYNEMATHPRKNMILKAMQPFQRQSASITHITDIQPDDYFYLCSDGMLEDMEDDELLEILRRDTTDQEKADQLIISTSNNADNHSAYLLRVKAVEAEPQDKQLKEDERGTSAANKALHDVRKDEAWTNDDFVSNDVEVVEPVEEHPQPVAVAPVSAEQPPKFIPSKKKQTKGGKKLLFLLLLLMLCVLGAGIYFLFLRKADQPAKSEQPNTEIVSKPNAAQTSQPANEEDKEEVPVERKQRIGKEPDQPSPTPTEAMTLRITTDDESETILPQ